MLITKFFLDPNDSSKTLFFAMKNVAKDIFVPLGEFGCETEDNGMEILLVVLPCILDQSRKIKMAKPS